MAESILGDKLAVILDQVREVQPKTYIEIGCYRCNTMHEVKKLGVPRLIGFDLFETAPTHEAPPLDGPPVSFADAQKFGYELYKGDTWLTLETLGRLEMEGPILVFIDGGHSFETTLQDIEQVQKHIPHCTILIDDVSMHGVALALKTSGLSWRKVGLETCRYDY